MLLFKSVAVNDLGPQLGWVSPSSAWKVVSGISFKPWLTFYCSLELLWKCPSSSQNQKNLRTAGLGRIRLPQTAIRWGWVFRPGFLMMRWTAMVPSISWKKAFVTCEKRRSPGGRQVFYMAAMAFESWYGMVWPNGWNLLTRFWFKFARSCSPERTQEEEAWWWRFAQKSCSKLFRGSYHLVRIKVFDSWLPRWSQQLLAHHLFAKARKLVSRNDISTFPRHGGLCMIWRDVSQKRKEKRARQQTQEKLQWIQWNRQGSKSLKWMRPRYRETLRCWGGATDEFNFQAFEPDATCTQ